MNKGAALIVILAGSVLFLFALSKNNESAGSVNNKGTAISLEPQTKSEAQVDIKVSPLDISDRSSEWKFDIALNTHTVELSQDMAQNSILIDGNGKEYRPLAWQGDPPGGHHLEGTLTFDPIVPLPQSIQLKILGVGGVPERVFAWQLKQQ